MGQIKLDKNNVKEIKFLCNTTTLIDREIAKMFGVSRKHINAIRHGKRWNYEYEETNQNNQETKG
jgi:hypothetical protein